MLSLDHIRNFALRSLAAYQSGTMVETAKQFLIEIGFNPEHGFSAVLIGGILAIMVGAILLIVTFTILNSILGITGSAGVLGNWSNGYSNAVLNSTSSSVVASIGQGLTITGIALIVIGIAIIIYTLLPIAGTMGGQGPGRGR